MKVLLDIEDSKAASLLEVLSGLTYVKTTTITKEKAKLIKQVKRAVDEVNLIKSGKIKGIPAVQLLDEI